MKKCSNMETAFLDTVTERELQQRSEAEQSASLVQMDFVLLEGSELHRGVTVCLTQLLHKTFNFIHATALCVYVLQQISPL